MKKTQCCKKCKRPKMPKDSGNFAKSITSSNSYLHWIVVFTVFVGFGVYWIPELANTRDEEHMSYYTPKIDLLRKKMPAIRISGIDFSSETVKDRLQELAIQMDYICSERSDDVIYAFQFGSNNHSRFRKDHIFGLCGQPTRVYGNAEVLSSSEEMVLCTEEYDGVLKQIKRPANVYIKAIDLSDWDVVEMPIDDTKSACIVQHAIDVLESKWV